MLKYMLDTNICIFTQMIAGHARSQGLILATNNICEFDRVAGLRVEDWAHSGR
jgi:tRNA(fMet)-specific endonuclease VapC